MFVGSLLKVLCRHQSSSCSRGAVRANRRHIETRARTVNKQGWHGWEVRCGIRVAGGLKGDKAPTSQPDSVPIVVHSLPRGQSCIGQGREARGLGVGAVQRIARGNGKSCQGHGGCCRPAVEVVEEDLDVLVRQEVAGALESQSEILAGPDRPAVVAVVERIGRNCVA